MNPHDDLHREIDPPDFGAEASRSDTARWRMRDPPSLLVARRRFFFGEEPLLDAHIN
jgi:hypothetical protein